MNRLIAPSLLIVGLGTSGIQVCTAVLRDCAQRRIPAPDVMGIGFEPTPTGFPADFYVSLTLDSASAVDTLIESQDGPHLKENYTKYAQLPRPFERLAWNNELKQGTTSRLARIGTRQFAVEQPDHKLVCIVADLSQRGGSSLLLDAAHWVRTLAKDKCKITMLAYAILPVANASEETYIRAFACLRELIRFRQLPGIDYLEKPIDGLYLFQPGIASAPRPSGSNRQEENPLVTEMAALLSAYLDELVSEKFLSTFVNDSLKTVRTARVRVLDLPVNRIQAYWQRELATLALTYWLYPVEQPSTVQTLLAKMWNTFNEEVLESLLNPGRLDRIANQVQSISFASADRLQRLLINDLKSRPMFIPERDMLTDLEEYPTLISSRHYDEVFHQTAILFRQVGLAPNGTFDRNNNNAYWALLEKAQLLRFDAFQRQVIKQLEQVLTVDQEAPMATLRCAQVLVDQLQKNLSRIRTQFSNLKLPKEKALGLTVRRLQGLKTNLQTFLPAPFFPSREFTDAWQDYIDRALNTLGAARYLILVEQLLTLIERYQNWLSHIASQLDSWETSLSSVLATLQRDLGASDLKSSDPTVQTLPDHFDDRWLISQKERYLSRQQGIEQEKLLFSNKVIKSQWRFRDQVTDPQLDLLLSERLFTVDELTADRLLEHIQPIFIGAENELALSALIQPSTLERLSAFLNQAVTPLLDLQNMPKTLRRESAYLVLSDREASSKQIDESLRQLRILPKIDSSVIQTFNGTQKQRLPFLYFTEGINLEREVTLYTVLESAYRANMDQAVDQQSYGLEQLLVQLEAADPDMPIFDQEVLEAMTAPQRLTDFWLAYGLELIKPNASGTQFTVYWNDLQWSLSAAGKDGSLAEAILAFVYHRAAPVSMEVLHQGIASTFAELADPSSVLPNEIPPDNEALQNCLVLSKQLSQGARNQIEAQIAAYILISHIRRRLAATFGANALQTPEGQHYYVANWLLRYRQERCYAVAQKIIFVRLGIVLPSHLSDPDVA